MFAVFIVLLIIAASLYLWFPYQTFTRLIQFKKWENDQNTWTYNCGMNISHFLRLHNHAIRITTKGFHTTSGHYLKHTTIFFRIINITMKKVDTIYSYCKVIKIKQRRKRLTMQGSSNTLSNILLTLQEYSFRLHDVC